nr:hypothetical protein [Tanacetum cinerariifolium]
VAKTTNNSTDPPIVVAPNFYHIDEQHHLIVINKPVEEVMVAGTENSSQLILDKEYNLVENTQVASTYNTYMVEYANTAYTVYFTELPVVSITTKYAIVDAPSVYATLTMSEASGIITSSNLGIYTLGERIDRKQLKLKKYTNTIKGELYKGAYWDDAVLFTSLPDFDNKSPYWGGFEYKHPEEYTDWKNLYDFVRFVETSSDAEFVKQYPSKFDLQNAVDYYIFMNVLRATDNY